jgi:hypothetical protein
VDFGLGCLEPGGPVEIAVDLESDWVEAAMHPVSSKRLAHAQTFSPLHGFGVEPRRRGRYPEPFV